MLYYSFKTSVLKTGSSLLFDCFSFKFCNSWRRFLYGSQALWPYCAFFPLCFLWNKSCAGFTSHSKTVFVQIIEYVAWTIFYDSVLGFCLWLIRYCSCTLDSCRQWSPLNFIHILMSVTNIWNEILTSNRRISKSVFQLRRILCNIFYQRFNC